MGQITSGVGLISGLPTKDIIDQLIAIESRPKAALQKEVGVLTSQQVAFNAVNAQLLSLKSTADALTQDSNFNATTAASSNENVLSVSSTGTAIPGTFTFLSQRLVGTQQSITRGFADADRTPLSSGTLSFEFGDARLDTNTKLSEVNGGANITRGNILITDRAGNTATIDLSKALTVNDVLEAINQTSGIQINAGIQGNAFKLTDTSGGTGSIQVSEIASGTTAASLGLLTDTDANATTYTGSSIHDAARSTFLTSLNDGLGIDISDAATDFDITLAGSANATFSVNLHLTTKALQTATATLGDVIDSINLAANQATGGAITNLAALSADGSGITLNTGNASDTITVTAQNSRAAFDLGI